MLNDDEYAAMGRLIAAGYDPGKPINNETSDRVFNDIATLLNVAIRDHQHDREPVTGIAERQNYDPNWDDFEDYRFA